MASKWLEDACRKLEIKDGRDPEKWKFYVSESQRNRVFAEIDARRNRGLFLCGAAMIALVVIPFILGR